MRKIQLPNSFKKIGLGIAMAAFFGMLINKFSIDSESVRMTLKYSLLLGFLIISISKEKVEDELIIGLRMQSYSFAFIFAVGYAFLLPVADYLVDVFFTSKSPELKAISNFELLWLLLAIQVLYFELQKKKA